MSGGIAARRATALVCALAVTALGVVVVTEVVTATGGHPPRWVPWRDWLDSLLHTRWQDGGVRVVSTLLLCSGLLLAMLAVRRDRRPVAALAPHTPALHAVLDREGAERVLERLLDADPAVSSVRVRLRGGALTVSAVTAGPAVAAAPTQDLASRLERTAAQQAAEWGLLLVSAPVVHVQTLAPASSGRQAVRAR